MLRSAYRIPVAAMATVVLAIGATGCTIGPGSGLGPGTRGSGDVATESRDVGDFTSIRVPGPVDVIATVGDATSVEVEADDNLLEFITTEVDGGALVVDAKDSFTTNGPLVVRVTAPSLGEIVADGAGDVEVEVGDTGAPLRIEASGAGNVTASGTVADLDIRADGAGDVDAVELAARTAVVESSGAGDVEVGDTETLEVAADGAGDVTYSGSPDLSVQNDGAGEVEQR